MSKSYAVVFAGVPGSSKTIVSNYLSVKFNLPVFNNDQLRFEVKEDMLSDNINEPDVLEEYEKRHTQRLTEFLATGHPMILDGSMDRRWTEVKKQFHMAGYSWYMINMELSRSFLERLFTSTGRTGFLIKLNNYWEQHQKFMKKHSGDVNLQITDGTFPRRIHLAANGLQEFIDNLEK